MSEPHSATLHSFCKFWRIAISEGATKSWETGFGKAIEIGALLLAIGLFGVKQYHKNHNTFDVSIGEEFVNYWVAILPLFAGGLWFLFHIFRQPYEIYKKQFTDHQEEIEEKDLKINEMSAEIIILQGKLAEKSEADKLVIAKQAAKELLGFRLRALEYRLQESRELNNYEFEGERKAKQWEATSRVFEETETCLRKHLTEAEGALFYIAKSAPIQEINNDPYFGQRRMDYAWHYNCIIAKRDCLAEILKRLD
jgi:hypothetical protein